MAVIPFKGFVPKVDIKWTIPLTMPKNGHWDFPSEMGGVHVGFIYVVFDKVLGRAYLGKKAYKGAGQYNRGKGTEWESYTSSSKIVNELIKANGKDTFEFIVLEQYKTKGTLSYAETWSLCFVESPTSDLWYNKRIEKLSWVVKEPITQRHKDRLQMVLGKMKDFQCALS